MDTAGVCRLGFGGHGNLPISTKVLSWIPVAQMVKARDGHTCKGRRIERRAKSGTFNRDSQTASKRIIFRLSYDTYDTYERDIL